VPTIELIKQIRVTYERHGWELRSVLLPPDAIQELTSEDRERFGKTQLREADFKALWFARASQGNREAWELRLISETPYALFEAFEADESEDDREAARLEMENRMREYARPGDA
jgi:hypothetical protein